MTSIHIVEDDQLMGELLDTLLTLEGYQVTVDKETSVLMATLTLDKPDILLMDVNLRGVNGLDLIEKFRSEAPDQKLVIVAQSGIEQEELALRAGANAFIQKPYDCDELIKLLHVLEAK